MDPNVVVKAIRKVCEGQCEYEIKLSETTKSVYCTLFFRAVSTSFRISDHYSNKRQIRTFVYQKHTKTKTTERFIRNAIKDLYRKSLYNAIESIALNSVCDRAVCYA